MTVPGSLAGLASGTWAGKEEDSPEKACALAGSCQWGALTVSPLHAPARATSARSDPEVSTPGLDRAIPVYDRPLEAPISKSTASRTRLAHRQR